MKNIIKNNPKTFTIICLLTIIVAACTIKLQVDQPELNVIIQLQNDGGIADASIADAEIIDANK